METPSMLGQAQNTGRVRQKLGHGEPVVPITPAGDEARFGPAMSHADTVPDVALSPARQQSDAEQHRSPIIIRLRPAVSVSGGLVQDIVGRGTHHRILRASGALPEAEVEEAAGAAGERETDASSNSTARADADQPSGSNVSPVEARWLPREAPRAPDAGAATDAPTAAGTAGGASLDDGISPQQPSVTQMPVPPAQHSIEQYVDQRPEPAADETAGDSRKGSADAAGVDGHEQADPETASTAPAVPARRSQRIRRRSARLESEDEDWMVTRGSSEVSSAAAGTPVSPTLRSGTAGASGGSGRQLRRRSALRPPTWQRRQSEMMLGRSTGRKAESASENEEVDVVGGLPNQATLLDVTPTTLAAPVPAPVSSRRPTAAQIAAEGAEEEAAAVHRTGRRTRRRIRPARLQIERDRDGDRPVSAAIARGRRRGTGAAHSGRPAEQLNAALQLLSVGRAASAEGALRAADAQAASETASGSTPTPRSAGVPAHVLFGTATFPSRSPIAPPTPVPTSPVPTTLPLATPGSAAATTPGHKAPVPSFWLPPLADVLASSSPRSLTPSRRAAPTGLAALQAAAAVVDQAERASASPHPRTRGTASAVSRRPPLKVAAPRSSAPAPAAAAGTSAAAPPVTAPTNTSSGSTSPGDGGNVLAIRHALAIAAERPRRAASALVSPRSATTATATATATPAGTPSPAVSPSGPVPSPHTAPAGEPPNAPVPPRPTWLERAARALHERPLAVAAALGSGLSGASAGASGGGGGGGAAAGPSDASARSGQDGAGAGAADAGGADAAPNGGIPAWVLIHRNYPLHRRKRGPRKATGAAAAATARAAKRVETALADEVGPMAVDAPPEHAPGQPSVAVAAPPTHEVPAVVQPRGLAELALRAAALTPGSGLSTPAPTPGPTPLATPVTPVHPGPKGEDELGGSNRTASGSSAFLSPRRAA